MDISDGGSCIIGTSSLCCAEEISCQVSLDTETLILYGVRITCNGKTVAEYADLTENPDKIKMFCKLFNKGSIELKQVNDILCDFVSSLYFC